MPPSSAAMASSFSPTMASGSAADPAAFARGGQPATTRSWIKALVLRERAEHLK
jgi:hypothetical protein